MLDTLYYPIKILEIMLDTFCRQEQNSSVRQIVAGQKLADHKNIMQPGGYPMDSSDTGSLKVPFVQQMLQNKFLLLTVALAVSAAAYFCIGLYFLLSH